MNCFRCFSSPTQESDITITNPFYVPSLHPKKDKMALNNLDTQIKIQKISLKKFSSRITSRNDNLMSTVGNDMQTKSCTQTHFRPVKLALKTVLLKQNTNKRYYHNRTNTVNYDNVGQSLLNFPDKYSPKPFSQFNNQRVRRAESMQNENEFGFKVSKGQNMIQHNREITILKGKENERKQKMKPDQSFSQNQFNEIKIQIKAFPKKISKVAFCLHQKDLPSQRNSLNHPQSDEISENSNYLKPEKPNNSMILSKISRQSAILSIQDVACIKTQSVGGSSEQSDKISEIIGTLKSARTLIEKPCSSTNFMDHKSERVQTQKQLKKTATTHKIFYEV